MAVCPDLSNWPAISSCRETSSQKACRNLSKLSNSLPCNPLATCPGILPAFPSDPLSHGPLTSGNELPPVTAPGEFRSSFALLGASISHGVRPKGSTCELGLATYVVGFGAGRSPRGSGVV